MTKQTFQHFWFRVGASQMGEDDVLDGQRLLIMRSVNPPNRTELYPVHNWIAELERSGVTLIPTQV